METRCTESATTQRQQEEIDNQLTVYRDQKIQRAGRNCVDERGNEGQEKGNQEYVALRFGGL